MSSGTGVKEQRLIPESLEDRLVGVLARGVGVVLLGVAALGWASLLTWSATDPSISHVTSGIPQNLLGSPGAIISDLMLQTLGFAIALALLAPMSWGVDLAADRRIDGFRIKACLLPLAVLAIAGGVAAVPRLAAWPLHHGFGGILGDVVHGVVSRLFAQINPERASLAAGLMLAAVGASALLACLGLRPADLAAVLPRPPRERRAPAAIDDPADHFTPEPHPDPRTVRRPAAASPRPHAAPSDAYPTLDPLPPMPPAAPGPVHRPMAPGGYEPMPSPAPAVARGSEFDASTEIDSRNIAERFAPASARQGAQRPQKAAGAEPAGRGLGGLLEAFASRSRAEPQYKRPSLNLLKRAAAARPGPDFTQAMLRGNARLLEDVLADFGVKGEVKDIRPGPVVTLYELEPARGTKSSRVIGLADDIARSMSATSARVAVVPGRNAIGIELPNVRRETVYLREALEGDAFRNTDAALPLVLGKSIGGEPIVADLARMPHLLVAGTTGSGKSVGVNAMILSLLYRLSPDQCRFLMIDPKMLELSVYNGIPHLLAPVVTDPHKAVGALEWAVREMEERYKSMAQLGVRNIEIFNNRVRNAKKHGEMLARTVQTGFNARTGEAEFQQEKLAFEPLPYIVVVVDEFADLMIVAGKEIEGAVQRLAQMARAAGIHLIMATQRPSVDIITGTIKANFPTRISFKVASKIDSRTILNEQGAEQLLGQGDMLYSNGSGHALRIHGPFVSDEEVESIAAALRAQGEPQYVDGIGEEPAVREIGGGDDGRAGSSADDLYDKAVAVVLRDRKASTSYVQRRLSIGYNRAADLIERMERDGIVGPANNVGKRDILVAGGGESDAA